MGDAKGIEYVVLGPEAFEEVAKLINDEFLTREPLVSYRSILSNPLWTSMHGSLRNNNEYMGFINQWKKNKKQKKTWRHSLNSGHEPLFSVHGLPFERLGNRRGNRHRAEEVPQFRSDYRRQGHQHRDLGRRQVKLYQDQSRSIYTSAEDWIWGGPYHHLSLWQIVLTLPLWAE